MDMASITKIKILKSGNYRAAHALHGKHQQEAPIRPN
jgi:hypothetical protein